MIVYYIWLTTVVFLAFTFIYTMWKMNRDSWMTKEESNEE
jgi:hypothetical protein